MPKPEQPANWATDANYPMDAAPEQGTATKVAPTLGQATLGWRPKARPPARQMNWWKNLVGRWTSWLGSIFDAFDNLTPQGGASVTLRNLPEWEASTAYDVGDLIAGHEGNVYECITAGVSAVGGDGPDTMDPDIVDGTVHWKFLNDSDGRGRFYSEATEFTVIGPNDWRAYTDGGAVIADDADFVLWSAGGIIVAPLSMFSGTAISGARIRRISAFVRGTVGDSITLTLEYVHNETVTPIATTGLLSADTGDAWSTGAWELAFDDANIEDARVGAVPGALRLKATGTAGTYLGNVTIAFDRAKPAP